MKIVRMIICCLGALFCWQLYPCNGAVEPKIGALAAELPTIRKAAKRNNCRGNDFLILLAIRKAKNGRSGCEFGIKYSKAWDMNLDTQAGWAAAIIVKNRARWVKAGCPCDFVTFLGDRYCPASVDPIGNKNWKQNVRYWFERFKQGCEKYHT